MNKKVIFSLTIASILLMAASCSSQKTASPVVNNPGPDSFSVSQTPVPGHETTPAPVTPTPTTTATSTIPTNTPPVSQPSSTVVTPPPPPTPVTPPAATTIQINIQNFSFNPAEVNITVGSTVVWTNNDSVPHQIASNNFNSQVLSQGNSFSQKFTVAGTFDYHCAIHPSMTGKLIVK